MKALIIGATGATGKDLVQVMLQDPAYTEVIAFVRRKSGVVHPKLKEVITDFDHLDLVANQISGDVWFTCLGTTLKTAGSKDKQWHIDYEMPLAFARIAKRNGVPKVVLLSVHGASRGSRLFYSKMKGQLEDAILQLDFSSCIIFRPGMLEREGTDRLGEQFIIPTLKFLNALGMLRKFRPLKTTLLAEKLAKAPKVLPNGKQVIALETIFKF